MFLIYPVNFLLFVRAGVGPERDNTMIELLHILLGNCMTATGTTP